MNQRDRDALTRIAQAEGFPTENAENYVAMLQGKPFVTTAGLQFKMEQKYTGGWAVKAVLPTPEEYALFREMVDTTDAMVVMKGIVEVVINGEVRTFQDYGTAHAGNMKGFVTMATYPIEMACRRATNRAMRLATQTGMASVDELDGSQTPQGAHKPPSRARSQGKAETYPAKDCASKSALDDYRHKLLQAYKEGVLNDEEYAGGKALADDPRGVLKAVLDKAMSRLKKLTDALDSALDGDE